MRINILVIDDVNEDVKMIKRFLHQASLKHDFYYAETLYEGVELCEENEIDIVLLNLVLPDSRGLQTLELFYERMPRDIPVIPMLTPSSQVDCFRMMYQI